MAAKNASNVDDYYVSSDCDKILNAASSLGYKKIVRPSELATANAKHIDVIKHSLEQLLTEDIEPDILVVLMANSGTVKTKWIEQAVNAIEKDPSISAVVPVFNDQDHHPYRAKKLDGSGLLQPFFNFDSMDVSTNRQELEPSYFLCHNFWVMNLNISYYAPGGQKPWTFLGDKIKPIIVEESFDVHSRDDLIKTEKWLTSNKIVG
jgi:CMP-N-acetylneuraminic acid synthetase